MNLLRDPGNNRHARYTRPDFSMTALIFAVLTELGILSPISLSVMLILIVAQSQRNFRFGRAWIYIAFGFVTSSGILELTSYLTGWSAYLVAALIVASTAGSALNIAFVMSAPHRGRMPHGTLSILLPLTLGSAVSSIGYEIAINSFSAAHGYIDTNYFAQVVQLIPVLLIALSTDLVFFRHRPNRLSSARTLVVVVICAIGELASLLVLIPPVVSEGMRDALTIAQLFALRVSLSAVAMSVAALAWGIAEHTRRAALEEWDH